MVLKFLLYPSGIEPFGVVPSKAVSCLPTMLENGGFVDFAPILVFSNYSRGICVPKSPDHTVKPQRHGAPQELELAQGDTSSL